MPPSKLTRTASTVEGIPDILSRIERLETIVLREQPATGVYSTKVADDSPRTTLSTVTTGSQTRDDQSQLLCNIRIGDNSLLPCLSYGMTFQICSTREIRTSFSSGVLPNTNQTNGIVVLFPTFKAANLLFRSFESHLDQMCSIVHIPTTRILVRTLCLKLSQGEPVPHGQVALLLSIFALSAFFYQPSENSEVAATEQDAVSLSKALCKGALDVLDQSRRNSSESLEDIQAYIIMSLIIFHLDGLSTRGRLMLTTAASIARILRLNRLDAEADNPSRCEPDVCTSIDREVKRRVFWHIATEDWLQSTTCGPQGGMYFIHPIHIAVKLPKDRFDDEIVLGNSTELVDGPQPCGMTYFLERVRLAQICREIADIVELVVSKLIQMPYENIIALDKKLEDFLSNLPFFFKCDEESRARTKPLEAVYPHIPIMRYSITHAAHSRRCKLHQRFLLRQSYDPRYAYSRRACLESARAVIQGFELLGTYDSLNYATSRLGTAMHYTYLALVIMVMDLCFNKDEADEVQMKMEIQTALKEFEDARRRSAHPGRFLGSLCEIMRNHNVYLVEPPAPVDNGIPNTVFEDVPNDFGFVSGQVQPSQVGLEMNVPEVVMDTSFDDFWNFASQAEPNLDSLTWDNMFSALDTRPI